MQDRVLDTIRRYGLINEGETVVVGLSGGPDSVALLHTLWTLAPKNGFTVCAAHLNHGIRGEAADGDENFVAELCEFYGVELFRERADIPGLARAHGQTLEQAGRVERYDFLERARRHMGAHKIAVAHHMDDQAESILLHLTRGSGLLGLTGMQPMRGNVIRPLLFLRRSEIVDYLTREGLAFRTDETNFQTDGTRNRLRIDVIPYIEKNINPAIVPTLCSMGELLLRDEAYLRGEAEALLARTKRVGGYDRKLLASASLPILTRAIRIALFEAGAEADIERVHVESVIELLSARTGAMLKLPYVDAWNSYELICFGSQAKRETFETELYETGITETPLGWFECEIVDGNAYSRDKFTAYMDLDKLNGYALTVRTRRDGDRFFPLGAPGRRKLKEFFIDKKVPREDRETPLICGGQDVLFVPGYTVAEDVRVDENTRHMLRAVYKDAKLYKK